MKVDVLLCKGSHSRCKPVAVKAYKQSEKPRVVRLFAKVRAESAAEIAEDNFDKMIYLCQKADKELLAKRDSAKAAHDHIEQAEEAVDTAAEDAVLQDESFDEVDTELTEVVEEVFDSVEAPEVSDASASATGDIEEEELLAMIEASEAEMRSRRS